MSYGGHANIYQQLGQTQPATAVHPHYQSAVQPTRAGPPVSRSAYQQHGHNQVQQSYNSAPSRPRPVSMPPTMQPQQTVPPQPRGRPLPNHPPGTNQFGPPPLHPSQYRPKLPNQAAPQLQQLSQRSLTQPQASLDRGPSPAFRPAGHPSEASYHSYNRSYDSSMQHRSSWGPSHSPQGSYSGGHSPQGSSSGGHSPQASSYGGHSPHPIPPQPSQPPVQHGRGRSYTYDSSGQWNNSGLPPAAWNNQQYASVQPAQQGYGYASTSPQKPYPDMQYQPPSQSYRQPSPASHIDTRSPSPQPSPQRQLPQHPPSPQPQYSRQSYHAAGPPSPQPQPSYQEQAYYPPLPPKPPRVMPPPEPYSPFDHQQPSPSPTRSDYVVNPRVSSPNPSAELVRKYSKKGRSSPVKFSSMDIAPSTNVEPEQPRPPPLAMPTEASYKAPPEPSQPPSSAYVLPSLPEVTDPKSFVPLYKRRSAAQKTEAFVPSIIPSQMRTPAVSEPSPTRGSRPLPSTPGTSGGPGTPHHLSFSPVKSNNSPLPPARPPVIAGTQSAPVANSHLLNRSDTTSTNSTTSSSAYGGIVEDEEPPPSPGVGIRDLHSRSNRPPAQTTPEPPSPGVGIRDLPNPKRQSANLPYGALRPGFQKTGLPEPPLMTRTYAQRGWHRRKDGQGYHSSDSEASADDEDEQDVHVSQTLRFAASDGPSTPKKQLPQPSPDTTPKNTRPSPRELPKMHRGTQSLSSAQSGQGQWPSNLPQLPRAPAVAGSASEPPQQQQQRYQEKRRSVPVLPPMSPKMTRAQFANGANSPRSPRFKNLDLDAELESGPPPPRSGFSPSPDTSRRGWDTQAFPMPPPQSGSWDVRQQQSSRAPPQPPQQRRSIPQPQIAQPSPPPQQPNGVITHTPSQGKVHHAQSHGPAVMIESPSPRGGREQKIEMDEAWEHVQHQQQQAPAPPLHQFARPQPPGRGHQRPQPGSRALPKPGSQPSTPKVNVFEVPGISIDSSPSSPSVPVITVDGGGTPSINVSEVPSISLPGDDSDSHGTPTLNTNPRNRPPIQKYPGLRLWHPDCFRCTVCDELLEHVSSYEHDGRPYCHLDYHENFAPRCFHCHTAILEPRFISIDDEELGGKRTYHENHFFCAECGDPFLDQARKVQGLLGSSEGELTLSDGQFEGFTVYRGHPYCETCHVRLRNPKCKRCKRAIRDGDEAVEALGAKWCKRCFCCEGCQRPFDDPSFYERDKKAWCEDCFSIILRNEV
ncbi:hypothetical protein DL96DRAFT_1598164 [Flagelloscypha sp. PMI_526]|nr:hypothetical protein DL96DRAFT_1598164 [Flagelloscypha sp. PMI_526]